MSDPYDELDALDQVNLQLIEENKRLKAERDRYIEEAGKWQNEWARVEQERIRYEAALEQIATGIVESDGYDLDFISCARKLAQKVLK